MPALRDIINFYKDCYLNDFGGVNINNFFSKKGELQFVPESMELLSGQFEEYSINTDWGRKAEQTLLLDSKEKALYAGSFFLKSKTKILGRVTKVFAPLYVHELNLSKANDVYSISLINTNINTAFFEGLKSIDETITISFDDFKKKIPSNPLGYQNLVALKLALTSMLPLWDFTSIDSKLRSLNKNEDCNKVYKSRASSNPKKIHFGLTLGIFKKPVGSRGVINELTEIAENNIESRLLNEIFIHPKEQIRRPKQRQIYVPTSLSDSQKKVFLALDNSNLTLVVGPPGTGKSFTIASLMIELMGQGKSVLFASKNNQAGKVIANKIEHDFGFTGILIKAQSKAYKRSLISRLNKIVYGMNGMENYHKTKTQKRVVEKKQAEIESIKKEMNEIETQEMKWGNFFYSKQKNFVDSVLSSWYQFIKNRSKPIWKLNEDLRIKEKQKDSLIRNYIKSNYKNTLFNVLVDQRSDFIQLIEALKESTGNLINAKFSTIDFNLILKALPAWICNSSDISTVLPLEEELFDVLIIDEASQCDISSTIPLLYRAKKVVIVGDPKQLRHYSFLSNYQQALFKSKHNLDSTILEYRDNSVLDLINSVVKSQYQVVFLDEHYRSTPSIIDFSNSKFYSGKLKIMTAMINPSQANSLNIEFIKGVRNEKGVNKIEAQAIIENLKSIILSEKSTSKKLSSTIGVLSPFRAQVNYIKSIVKSTFDLMEIKKHKLLIGTPYHFQGEERDIMLLSFAIDNDTHKSTLNYLNKEDVFNVSITRAKAKQIVHTSFDYNTCGNYNLFSNYLSSIDLKQQKEQQEKDTVDRFTEGVVKTIQEWDVDKITQNLLVSGVRIDIVVINKGKTYCIDLIGYPGEFERQFTSSNILMLNRMRQKIFFLPFSNWHLEKENSTKNLKRFLGISSNLVISS